MLPKHLQQLVRHMEWADALVWNSALALPRAHHDKLMRERFHHVHSVHWAYLQIWRGEPLDLADLTTFEDLRAIHAWSRGFYGEVAGHLGTLDAEALQQEINFPWADELVERFGAAQPATFAETILQLSSHTTHHRGQICTRLREIGGEPPLIDFIAWIWTGKPAPEWSGP